MLSLLDNQLESLKQDSDLITDHLQTMLHSHRNSHLASEDKSKSVAVSLFKDKKHSIQALEHQTTNLCEREHQYLT